MTEWTEPTLGVTILQFAGRRRASFGFSLAGVMWLPRTAAEVLARLMWERDDNAGGPTVMEVSLVSRQPRELATHRDLTQDRAALSGEQVQAGVTRVLGLIHACFGQRAPRGALSLDVDIGADGKVVDAAIAASSLEHDDIATCMASVMRLAVFAAPKSGAATLHLPLEF
jgi:hypothetical protein